MPRLNTLLCVHLAPINVIISHGSITIPHLRGGFPLRCFQRLSGPNIATLRCPWQDSRYTRGSFVLVLSSCSLYSQKPIYELDESANTCESALHHWRHRLYLHPFVVRRIRVSAYYSGVIQASSARASTIFISSTLQWNRIQSLRGYICSDFWGQIYTIHTFDNSDFPQYPSN